MKYYHGSKKDLSLISRSQAFKVGDAEAKEGELLNAIYLTSDYGFALACAVRPVGVTRIDHFDKKIVFDNPDQFEPDREVFVYEVEIENIPKENIRVIDDYQIAIINIEELSIVRQFKHKAREIEQYYELVNWVENATDISLEHKIK